jgi:hypothetical protein
MECPFCIETLKDEAVVCRICTRDLTLVRPVFFEIQSLIGEIAGLQRELTGAQMRLALIETPARFLSAQVGMFVVLPSRTSRSRRGDSGPVRNDRRMMPP